MGRFKTKFCWWPVRLARHVKDAPPDKPNMEFIGWAWMQRVALTNNLTHGWVAFLDAKPEPEKCKKCGQLLPPNAKVSGDKALPECVSSYGLCE